MPDNTLKDGAIADPFITRVSGKDQGRVPTGNPNSPIVADVVGDEAIQRKKRAEQLMAQTRLREY